VKPTPPKKGNVNGVNWTDMGELKFIEKIATGGRKGEVWNGSFRGQNIALKKFIVQSGADDEERRQRFENEVEMLASLRHPNVVLVVCACSTSIDELIIGYEQIPKGSLAKILEQAEHPTNVDKFKIAHTTALALQWVHKTQIKLHGSLSPSKILVGEGFQAKLCGFGIDGVCAPIVKGDAAQLTFMPDHVWRAPEFFKGHGTQTSASDVYSCALLYWSLFQPAEAKKRIPYSQYDKDNFYSKVVVGQERPSTSGFDPLLAKTLSDMWVPEPSKRVSMGDIAPSIFTMMVDVNLTCPDARRVWREAVNQCKFEDQTYVNMHIFIERLFVGTGEVKPVPTDPAYRCVERMFGTEIAATGETTKFVKLERFAQVLQWLGPLRGRRTQKTKWIASLVELMKREWFHAESTKAECDTSISNSKKIGSYLIRFSNNVGTPFTLAKLEKINLITNYRIYSTDEGYFLQVNDQKLYNEGTLPQLIENKKVKSALGLAQAVPYHQFNDLFVVNPDLAGCYGGFQDVSATYQHSTDSS